MRDLDVTALKGGAVSPYEVIKRCRHKMYRLTVTLYLTFHEFQVGYPYRSHAYKYAHLFHP
jgi:hypothetical protein